MEYNNMRISELWEVTSKISAQITKVHKFKASNMIFHDPENGSITGANKEKNFTYKRVNISTKYPDGTEGPLLFQTEHCFFFWCSKKNS